MILSIICSHNIIIICVIPQSALSVLLDALALVKTEQWESCFTVKWKSIKINPGSKFEKGDTEHASVTCNITEIKHYTESCKIRYSLGVYPL